MNAIERMRTFYDLAGASTQVVGQIDAMGSGCVRLTGVLAVELPGKFDRMVKQLATAAFDIADIRLTRCNCGCQLDFGRMRIAVSPTQAVLREINGVNYVTIGISLGVACACTKLLATAILVTDIEFSKWGDNGV